MTADKLRLLRTTKTAILDEIAAAGVDISEDTPLSAYPGYILRIGPGDGTIPVESVTINGLSLQTVAVGKTLQLETTITPANATDQSLTWTTTAPNYATVENGLVTGIEPGLAVITATAHNGVSYSMSVRVTAF